MKIIHRSISKLYRHLARLIARHPLYFLFVPLILSLLLSLGILNISYRRDAIKLFAPTDGKSVKERQLTEKYFPLNISTEYDLGRITEAGMNLLVVINPIDEKCVLREDIFEEIRLIDHMVRDYNVIWRGKEMNYSQICATNFGQCVHNVGLFDNETIANFRKGVFTIKYPVEIDLQTYKVTPYVYNFGGVTTDNQGYITEALAYRLIYASQSGSKEAFQASKQWVHALRRKLQNTKFRHIDISIGSNDYEEYSKQYTDDIISIGSVSVASIFLFCMLTCMTTDWIRSKPWLGISAFVSAVLATVSSFGLMMICGVNFIDVNSALPFLMIGMGIDDSFVLLAAWRRCVVEEEVEKRMENTYSEVALSITITSLTNIISFVAGIFTPFPAISIFCAYASLGICFNFLYQMTFFGSCLALTGYREHNGLNPFTCRKGIGDYKTPKKEHVMNFLGNTLGRQMIKPKLKLLILICCLSSLGAGLWGITQIKQGLDTTQIVPKKSPIYKFTLSLNKYFSKYSNRIQIIISSPVNYADKSIQYQIENTLKKFEANPLITDSNYTESWLRAYFMFISNPASKFSLGAFNISEKQDFIDGLRVFLRFPQTRNFRRDVIFNDDYTEIVASRFFVLCDDVKNKGDEKFLIETMWNIAEHSEIPVITFSYLFFFFEQLIAIKPVAIQTLSIAVAAVMFIFFFFISNVICCICIALTVIIIAIETIGFMALWGVGLDIFSLINLIMCIGFCVNYPAHVTYAYVTSKNTKLDDRLQSSLYAMGLPILQGSLSTLIGISVLLMDSSYMFTVFVKIVFLVVILTALHSFFFVPVILDVCHRYCCCSIYEDKVLLRKSASNEQLK